MLGLLVATQLLLGAATPDAPAQQAYRHLTRVFEKIGRTAPQRDVNLDRAAKALARGALQSRLADAADSLAVTRAVSAGPAHDPSPRALILRASPPAQALAAFEAREDLNAEPATHVGIGWAEDADRAALVVLLAERKSNLEPFAREEKSVGAPRLLCGALIAPLAKPEVFVTRPSGAVDKILPTLRGERFCAPVPRNLPGRYTVEVLGTGPRGPEVAALFFADVGSVAAAVERSTPEPASAAEAARIILARINALRIANNAAPVTVDAALAAVAQRYSDQMAREHFFAHVSPEGGSLAERLHAGNYPYARAGENLGSAQGPLSAHFGIEHSPGHRKNLVDPGFGRVGIGISVEHLPGREQTLLTEVLAVPVTHSEHPLEDAYQGLAERRASLQLPPLRRSPALEAVALAHVRRALEADEPHADLPGVPIHERIFAAVPDATAASVDLYLTQDLSHLPDSKSLRDPKNDLVGIGAVKGDSPRYGNGNTWVVVIYARSQRPL